LDLTQEELTLKYWVFEERSNEINCYAPHSHRKAYTGTHIFYIDQLNFTIGSFDRYKKEIELVYTFPEGSCSGFLNDIQIGDNKLYVLDTGGTLHVFEKTQ
jgi:hypothetical protein